ncbi:MAG: FIST N-terminal domain-containing protein [Candidatus Methylacidiphilales bacterium]|nr:FIST N-terminal domain-containing protein [Candidatus Methylacidiphilales bacterium]
MSAASLVINGVFDEAVVRTAAEQLRATCGGRAGAAFAFVSEDYLPELESFCDLVRVHGHVPSIFGSTAAGLVGAGREYEGESGAALLFLDLPGATFFPMAFGREQTEPSMTPEAWHRRAGARADEVKAWVVLANPLALGVDPWLDSWNKAWPGIPCVGGLASSRLGPQGIQVFADGEVVREGGLAIGIKGDFIMRTAISQGCKPIGEPLTITQAQDHVVLQLGLRSAYEVLNEVIGSMDEAERERAKGNIFAGLAMSEYHDDFQAGDFLVRNIVAADPASGAVVVGAWPRVGQTLQYQMREKDTAQSDYHRMLDELQRLGTPMASLVFTCTGRGSRFFGEPGHDARMLAHALGAHPSAGLFCNGEIGPVAGRTFAHGYSATLALFYPQKDS